MKKIIALTMALTLALTLFVGCASGNTEDTTENTTESTGEPVDDSQQDSQDTVSAPQSAEELLQNIWDAYGEDEQFAAFGGDMETHNAKMEADETYEIPNGPGTYAMEYIENLPYTLRVPADILSNVDDAATLVHLMLANNFTGGALHLVEGADVEAITASIRDELSNTQWMCGFPDRYLVAVVGEYVVVAFGLNDMMDPFQNYLTQCYPDAEIAYNEDIA